MKWRVTSTLDDGPPPPKPPDGPPTRGFVTLEELEAKVVALEDSVKSSLGDFHQSLLLEMSKFDREDSAVGLPPRVMEVPLRVVDVSW